MTINGFYYVSFCQETGNLEKLYYDPASGSREDEGVDGGADK